MINKMSTVRMKPEKYSWTEPRFIGTLQKNKILHISSSSLIVDKNKRTIWVDLTIEHFSTKKNGEKQFIYPIKRFKVGTNEDFKLLPINFTNDPLNNGKIIDLLKDYSFWSFFENPQEPIKIKSFRDKINFLKQIIAKIEQAKQQGQGTSLPESIEKSLDIFKEDFNILENIANFSDNLRTESIGELVRNPNYFLLIGELTADEVIEYKIATEEDNIKKPDEKKFSNKEIAKYFSNIILDDTIKRAIYQGVGLPRILEGKKPNTGGIIMLDTGGTGKSLMKAALKKFFTDLSGDVNSVKEKTQGDVSSYVNSGPQVIKKWFRGGPDDQVTGPEEADLVAIAKKRGTPSLLVIDEAEEFIRDRQGDASKDPINALNTLKRFIQDAEKGGVTGYVITILIANIDIEAIHNPLIQGAERLTSIYLGLPKNTELWKEILNIAFKNLKFNNNNFLPEILANLLLYHNQTVTNEELGISPRRIIAYCSDYYEIHTKNSKNNSKGDLTYFKELRSKKNSNKWEIDFQEFVYNFINEVLFEKINNDSELTGKNAIKQNYLAYLKYFQGEKKISIEERVEEQKKERMKRQVEVLEGVLKKEYDEITTTLKKLLNLCLQNPDNFISEGLFITPISNLHDLVNVFLQDFEHDPNVNPQHMNILNETLTDLENLFRRIIENKTLDSDLILFGNLVRNLPNTDDLFVSESKDKSNGIIQL